jgi:hypothetical protein
MKKPSRRICASAVPKGLRVNHQACLQSIITQKYSKIQNSPRVEEVKRLKNINVTINKFYNNSTGLKTIFCQGGIATIFNRTYNEFYTKREPVKNGVY